MFCAGFSIAPPKRTASGKNKCNRGVSNCTPIRAQIQYCRSVPSVPRHQGKTCRAETPSTLDAELAAQRQVARGTAHFDRVFARHEFPTILVLIEDGQIVRVEIEGHRFGFAGLERNLLE